MFALVAALLQTVSFAATPICNGRYQSVECHYTIWFNDCKNSVAIDWPGLKIPGNKATKEQKRNWCSVKYESSDGVVEHKLKPENCDRIVSFVAPAKKNLPEIDWQDTPCTHYTGKDAILYLKETNPDSVGAVRLNEARACKVELQSIKPAKTRNRQVYHSENKNTVLRCPVLPDRSVAWLKQFTERVRMKFVIQNDLK